jgi:hypothetical protein
MGVMKSLWNLAAWDTTGFPIDLRAAAVIFMLIPHRALQLPEPFSIIFVRTKPRVYVWAGEVWGCPRV